MDRPTAPLTRPPWSAVAVGAACGSLLALHSGHGWGLTAALVLVAVEIEKWLVRSGRLYAP